MGTSSSGGGAGGSNPLIPSWIPSAVGGVDGDSTPENGASDGEGQADSEKNPQNDGPSKDAAENKPQDGAGGNKPSQPDSQIRPSGNRYRQPRSDFNKYVKSGGKDSGSLRKALKGYSRKASGNTTKLARRMTPATSRVAGFYQAVNTIKSQGLETALKQFNLSSYKDRSLSDTLSALCDEIFKDTGRLYENTQDDSINKLAYANTIVRICEVENIDLNSLTNDNIEVMMAVFIEETIAQRVICDIGNELTKRESDIDKLIEIENNVYQIVNGLVRNKIMPEIQATQRGDKKDIEKNIENIYRIAFDTIADIKD